MIRKYLPYLYSGAISAVLFDIMTDFYMSDAIFDLNNSVIYIMPVFVAVASAVILYRAIVKSSGKTGWGVLINALVFNATNILYLILPIKIFADTLGDDPGNLLFMFAWMIYFPSALVLNGLGIIFAKE